MSFCNKTNNTLIVDTVKSSLTELSMKYFSRWSWRLGHTSKMCFTVEVAHRFHIVAHHH